MDDKKQVKAQGLRFARSLQTLVKMVNMFSADHKSATGMLQRSYDLLNPLVKQSRHLTLGFVDQRILLNNILTAEDGLKPLENEFLKRGIGAVTFEAGITLAAYRNAISAISANAKLIEESGGLLPFLEQRQLEFVRIFPATKTETRNEDGDTVLDMGSEEYLISKALSSMNSGLPQGIEALLTQMEGPEEGAQLTALARAIVDPAMERAATERKRWHRERQEQWRRDGVRRSRQRRAGSRRLPDGNAAHGRAEV